MWSVVFREPNSRFAVRAGFRTEDAAVMALVHDKSLQSKPLVVESWKAAPLIAILNATEPPP